MKIDERAAFTPEDLTEEDVKTKSDVESHSALLTNRRIDMLLQAADELGYTANTSPTMAAIINYRGILVQIYTDVFMIFTESRTELGVFQTLFTDFETAFHAALSADYNLNTHFSLCAKLTRIHRAINLSLQSRNYFFRTSRRRVRGFMEALQLYKDEGLKFADLVDKGEENKDGTGEPAENGTGEPGEEDSDV